MTLEFFKPNLIKIIITLFLAVKVHRLTRDPNFYPPLAEADFSF